MIGIALLHGDPSPSLRHRVAVELDGDSVGSLAGEIGSSPLVRALLAELEGATDAHALGYLLCQLVHLAYEGPEVAAAVERLFALQADDGTWQSHPRVAEPRQSSRKAAPPIAPSDLARFVTMDTVVPLRGIAAAGFATDPRAEHAFDWLVDARLPDGSWPAGPKADLGSDGRPSLPEPEYRRLVRGRGCRSATTGAVAALAHHPERRRSDEARLGVDHLLARETRDSATLGWEVSRLVGLERPMGRVTFYATFDPAFVLDLASRCDVSSEDRRVGDLLDWLDTQRGPFGLWEHPAHPQLSRWLTFDLEASRRRLRPDGWKGDETPAAFTPYQRGRRRH